MNTGWAAAAAAQGAESVYGKFRLMNTGRVSAAEYAAEESIACIRLSSIAVT